MVRINSRQYLLFTTLFLSATGLTVAAQAAPADLQQGMKAYQGKDYGGAIANLLKANQKDPLVRYYLGLSYQAIGNFQDAQKQYSWVYDHSPSHDLKSKSMQGLQGLATLSNHRQLVVEKNISRTVPQVSPQATSINQGPGTSIGHLDNRYFKVDWRPGCPNH